MTKSLPAEALGSRRPSGDRVLLGRNEIFEEHVLPNINDPEAKARHVVVIDIETEKYEVSEGPIHARDATQRLLERCPEAKGRIWTRRVGSPVAHRLGGRVLPAEDNTP